MELRAQQEDAKPHSGAGAASEQIEWGTTPEAQSAGLATNAAGRLIRRIGWLKWAEWLLRASGITLFALVVLAVFGDWLRWSTRAGEGFDWIREPLARLADWFPFRSPGPGPGIPFNPPSQDAVASHISYIAVGIKLAGVGFLETLARYARSLQLRSLTSETEMRALGPFLDYIAEHRDRSHPAIIHALSRLLERAAPADAKIFTRGRKEALHALLAENRRPDLSCAFLGALKRIGERDDMDRLDGLLRRSIETEPSKHASGFFRFVARRKPGGLAPIDQETVDDIARTREAIGERLRAIEVRGSLLTPAEAPDSWQLLRPATGKNETETNLLLRPSGSGSVAPDP